MYFLLPIVHGMPGTFWFLLPDVVRQQVLLRVLLSDGGQLPLIYLFYFGELLTLRLQAHQGFLHPLAHPILCCMMFHPIMVAKFRMQTVEGFQIPTGNHPYSITLHVPSSHNRLTNSHNTRLSSSMTAMYASSTLSTLNFLL